MSRRDIETVCTLAAHLAQRMGVKGIPLEVMPASKCAESAMLLQKLGRSTWNSYQKTGHVSYDHEAVCIRNRAKADEILGPYGLRSATRHGSLVIMGLPGNALGGTTDGFQI